MKHTIMLDKTNNKNMVTMTTNKSQKDNLTTNTNQNNNKPVKEKRRNNEKRKEKSRDAARCRRSRETEIFSDLAQALPLQREDVDQLDKASVMRLSISFLKVRDMLQLLFPLIIDLQKDEEKIKSFVKEDDESDVEDEDDEKDEDDHKEIKPFDSLIDLKDQKHVLQTLDGFLMILSGDGDVTYVSENITEYLGISQIDIMGQPIWDYTNERDHDELREALNGRRGSPSELQNGTISGDCLPHVYRDFFIRLKCTLTGRGRSVNIKSATYKVIHISGHIATNSNGLRQLVSIARPLPHASNIDVPLGSQTFLTKHSLDMKFTFVDDNMHKLLGYKPEHLLKKSLYDYHHGGDSEGLRTTFKSLISKNQSETSRYRFLARCGGYSWVLTQASIVFDKQKPSSVVCVNYVISGIENEDEIFSCAQLEAQQQQQQKEQSQQTPLSKEGKAKSTETTTATTTATAASTTKTEETGLLSQNNNKELPKKLHQNVNIKKVNLVNNNNNNTNKNIVKQENICEILTTRPNNHINIKNNINSNNNINIKLLVDNIDGDNNNNNNNLNKKQIQTIKFEDKKQNNENILNCKNILNNFNINNNTKNIIIKATATVQPIIKNKTVEQLNQGQHNNITSNLLLSQQQQQQQLKLSNNQSENNYQISSTVPQQQSLNSHLYQPNHYPRARSVTAAIFAAAGRLPQASTTTTVASTVALPTTVVTSSPTTTSTTQYYLNNSQNKQQHQQQLQTPTIVRCNNFINSKCYSPLPPTLLSGGTDNLQLLGNLTKAQNATTKTFVPRTEDMNKGFFLYSEEERGITMLKDSDDLTQLAPTAGDTCISLEETPFFSDVFDGFILPENYCSLLSDDISSLDSQTSQNHKTNIDPLLNHPDESSNTSGSSHLLSPSGLSKCTEGSSLSPLCSPDSLPPDDLAFMTMNIDDDMELTMRAPYIPMSEGDDLPILMSDDLMWGAFPEGLSLHKTLSCDLNARDAAVVSSAVINSANKHNIINNYKNNLNNEKIESNLAALLCGTNTNSPLLQQQQQQNQNHQHGHGHGHNNHINNNNNQQQQQQQHHNHQQLNQTQQHQHDINSKKTKLIDQGGGNFVDHSEDISHVFNKNCSNLDSWSMNDLLEINTQNNSPIITTPTTCLRTIKIEKTTDNIPNGISTQIDGHTFNLQQNNNINNNTDNKSRNNSNINNNNNNISKNRNPTITLITNKKGERAISNKRPSNVSSIESNSSSKRVKQSSSSLNCHSSSSVSSIATVATVTAAMKSHLSSSLSSSPSSRSSSPRLTNSASSSRSSSLASSPSPNDVQSSPQLLQQLMAPSPTPQRARSKIGIKDEPRWTNDRGGQSQMSGLSSPASNSVLMNLLVSGCDDISMEPPELMMDDSCSASQDRILNSALIYERSPNVLLSSAAVPKHSPQYHNSSTHISNPMIGGCNGLITPPILQTRNSLNLNVSTSLLTAADMEIWRSLQQLELQQGKRNDKSTNINGHIFDNTGLGGSPSSVLCDNDINFSSVSSSVSLPSYFELNEQDYETNTQINELVLHEADIGFTGYHVLTNNNNNNNTI